jgi:hypothetical protein
MAEIAMNNAGTAGLYRKMLAKEQARFPGAKGSAVAAILAAAQYANKEDGSMEPLEKMQNLLREILPGAFTPSMGAPKDEGLAKGARAVEESNLKDKVESKVKKAAPLSESAEKILEGAKGVIQGKLGDENENPFRSDFGASKSLVNDSDQRWNQNIENGATTSRQKMVENNMPTIESMMSNQANKSPSFMRKASSNLFGDYQGALGYASNHTIMGPASVIGDVANKAVNSPEGTFEKPFEEFKNMAMESDVIGPIENFSDKTAAVINGAGAYIRNLFKTGDVGESIKMAAQEIVTSMPAHSEQGFAKQLDAHAGALAAAYSGLFETGTLSGDVEEKIQELQSESNAAIMESMKPMQQMYGLSDAKMEAMVTGLQMGVFRDVDQNNGWSYMNAFLPDEAQNESVAHNSNWYKKNFNALKEESRPIYEKMYSDPEEREAALNEITANEMDVLTNAYDAGDHGLNFMQPILALQTAQDKYNGK